MKFNTLNEAEGNRNKTHIIIGLIFIGLFLFFSYVLFFSEIPSLFNIRVLKINQTARSLWYQWRMTR